MKKLLSLLLSMALLFQLVVPVWGMETAREKTAPTLSEAVQETTKIETADALLAPGTRVFGAQYGPLNEGKAVPNRVTPPRYYAGEGAFDPNNFYTEDADVLEAIASGLEQRKTTITVPWRIPASAVSTDEELLALIFVALAMAMDHTGEPTRGDYLLLSYHYLEYGGEVIAYDGNYYYINLVYDNVVYYTTAAQEAALTAKLEQVMASFGFTAETDDYTKIKTIYDYICANVAYDEEHVDDVNYLPMFSAYAALMDGKAVCQGYATLLYRMLLMAGVDNRVIVGDSSGVGHAWNIVQLGGFYYNLDSTWDAGMAEYEFFLKCPDNFPDHTREAAYDSAEFHAAYPMAAADYVPGGNPVIGKGTCGENVAWVLTADGKLTISGEGAMEDYNGLGTPWSAYSEHIKSVVVEEGVTHIGAYICFTFGKLLTVHIPSSVKTIGRSAFGNCYFIEEVHINDLAAWCQITFSSNPLYYGQNLYLDGEQIIDLVIPDTVTAISVGAFEGGVFQSVTIPGSVKTIGNEAFRDAKITTLLLSEGLESIGADAFSNGKVTSVIFPSTLQEIGAYAFSSYSLKSITFKGNAPTIGSSAFRNATATAYYPAGNTTWTADVMKNYGGNVTWIARCAHIFEDGYCTVCGAPETLPGDFTGDELVTNEDVSYLLWHTLFPENYPIDNEADFTGDGKVTNEDVSYLLWHTLFPENYPLLVPASSNEGGKKE